MHIGKNMEKIRKYIYPALGMVLCLRVCACGSRETEEAEMTSEEIEKLEEKFEQYEDENDYLGFDIREIEQQIDGFWDYNEIYRKSMEERDHVIRDWEGDFVEEGIYEVGKDIPAGIYVYCDPDAQKNETDLEVRYGLEDLQRKGWSNQILKSSYFLYYKLKEGEIIKITGHPKFALADSFPENKTAKNGVYYGTLYKIGEELPKGDYFMLSMDIDYGEIHLWQWPRSEEFKQWNQRSQNRFGYFRVEGEGYIELKDCILISMEQKPEIHPVSHENISGDMTWTDLFVGILGIGHHNEDYAQPIYAQGEYRIGEDIPIGTYQIQNEAVWPITDRNSTKRHSYSMRGYGKWTGLIIPYQDMAERCGFQFMQTDGSMKYVRITDAFGEKSYVAVKKGEKPTVTFTEEEKGCIVRLARVLLIPEGE